jgi:hypothetical protein
MGRRLAGAVTAAAAASLWLCSTSSAELPTEFGDRCVADDSEAGWTVIGVGNGGADPLFRSSLAPEESGVITRWRIEVAPGAGSLQQQLLALQPVDEQADRLLGESALETVVEGANEFSTRIPIPEYAHIGLRGPVGTYFCDKETGHQAGIVDEPFAVGEAGKFDVGLDTGVPTTVFVEPDRDGDGYGDVSQDLCTTRTKYHELCPVASFRAGRTKVKRRAVLVDTEIHVTTRIYAAPIVEVRARGSWAERRRGTPAHGGLFTISTGPVEVPVELGSTFRLPLPKRVVGRLARMPRNEFIALRLHAAVVNGQEVASREFSRSWTVKLRGRKKPRHHHRQAHRQRR